MNRKWMKNLGILLTAALLLTRCSASNETVSASSENPLLKADGKVLRDNAGEGKVVQLKGTNAGGYLFEEFWMTPTNVTGKVSVFPSGIGIWWMRNEIFARTGLTGL